MECSNVKTLLVSPSDLSDGRGCWSALLVSVLQLSWCDLSVSLPASRPRKHKKEWDHRIPNRQSQRVSFPDWKMIQPWQMIRVFSKRYQRQPSWGELTRGEKGGVKHPQRPELVRSLLTALLQAGPHFLSPSAVTNQGYPWLFCLLQACGGCIVEVDFASHLTPQCWSRRFDSTGSSMWVRTMALCWMVCANRRSLAQPFGYQTFREQEGSIGKPLPREFAL